MKDNKTIKVVVTEPVREIITYKLIVSTDDEHSYPSTTLVLRKEDEYLKLLEQAKNELRSFRRKYNPLNELKKVLDAIDEVL